MPSLYPTNKSILTRLTGLLLHRVDRYVQRRYRRGDRSKDTGVPYNRQSFVVEAIEEKLNRFDDLKTIKNLEKEIEELMAQIRELQAKLNGENKDDNKN